MEIEPETQRATDSLPPPSAGPHFDPERLSAALIVAASLAMVAFSWLKWADPVIDFGTELYIPWRLHEGDLLYRDIAHTYAPLSSYVNLGWFTVFGVSYLSLVAGNAVLLSALLFLFYRLLRKVASLAAATAAILIVVLVFAFAQYLRIGNYNYLSPYSHELTHGLVLSMAALSALTRYFESSNWKAMAAFGLALGLVFLTKYDVFFAAAGAGAVGLTAFWRASRRAPPWPDLLALLVALPAPFLVCWALLSSGLPAGTALRAALGAYPLLLNSQLMANPLFSESGGTDAPWVAFVGLVVWVGFYALATLPAACLGRAEIALDQRIYWTAAFLLPFVTLGFLGRFLPWGQALVLLPLFLIASAFAVFRSHPPAGSPEVSTHSLRLALTVFALLLLLKIPLAARANHFGFALAMPGAALLVVAIVDTVPSWLDSRGLSGRYFRIAAYGLLVVFAGAHVGMASGFFAERIYSMGNGNDALRVDQRGAVVARAVQVVQERVRPEEMLVVVPEGAIVNYLARRRSSVSTLLFTPFTLARNGEQAVLQELRATPPHYVLAFSREMRDLREMGCAAFGSACAQGIGAWLKSNYSPRVIAESRGRPLFTLLSRVEDSPSGQSPEVIEVTLAR